MAVTMTTAVDNYTVELLYHVDTPRIAHWAVRSNKTAFALAAKKTQLGPGAQAELVGIQMDFTDKRVLTVSNGAWAIQAKTCSLPYKRLNPGKARMDLTIHPIGDINNDPVAPHGTLPPFCTPRIPYPNPALYRATCVPRTRDPYPNVEPRATCVCHAFLSAR